MLNNKKGFTLIEIVVAMAILFLISIGFISLFSFSVGAIFGAGDKSEKIFDAQGRVDNAIEVDDPSSIEGVTSEDKNITIDFPDADDLVVEGEKLVIEYEYNDHISHITYFLPQDKEGD